MAVERPRRPKEGRGASDPGVVREFARSPGAVWIERSRTVSRKAFESAARRARRGGFGVAVRIHDVRGRVLLVRMAPGKAWTRGWVVPGGGAEEGESPRAAALREVKEETNLRVTDLRLWKVYHEVVRGPRGGGSIAWDFLQFTARRASGTVRSNVPEEIAEARWFRGLPKETAFRDDWLRPPAHLSRKAEASSRGRA